MRKRAAGVPGTLLKGPHTNLLADRLTCFELSTTAAAQKVPGTYGEKLNCLASGRRLEKEVPPDRSASRGHRSFIESSPHLACRLR